LVTSYKNEDRLRLNYLKAYTLKYIRLIIFIIIIIIRPPVLHYRRPLEIMNEKNTNYRCVSAGYVDALPPQNIIAERIGETDGIKALDRNETALKKEKCLSWVVELSV